MFPAISDKSMQSKRKAFINLSDIPSDDETTYNPLKCTSIQDMLPTKIDSENNISTELPLDRFQNLHPLLPWYKFNLNTSSM